MHDTFLSDTEAPSLGLYLVRVPSGIAYEVKRSDDGVYHSVNTGVDETLFCGSKAQVKLFLRGYAAALDHPAIKALSDAIDDEEAGNGRILDTAIEVANIAPGGRS